MAFPTGYTKYQEITIDYTKVSADQTDFIIYINLADLVKAGADLFDLCRSDGGDIRVTKSDGTTQLPREVVAIDTVAKTGELHVKYTGTLSSTVNTVIRIYYNGVDTEPAVTDTYGRNNVWSSKYDLVHHLQNATTNAVNGNTPSSNTFSYDSTSKLGVGITQTDGNTRGLDWGTSVPMNTTTMSISAWFNSNEAFTQDNSGMTLFVYTRAGTPYEGFYLMMVMGSVTGDRGKIQAGLKNSSLTSFSAISPSTYNDGNWHLAHATYDGSTIRVYVDGTQVASVAASGTPGAGFKTTIGGNWDEAASNVWVDDYDEVRATDGAALSASWILTEYRNQNSPSTFYSVGNEVGGGTAYTKDVDETATVTDTIRRATSKRLTESRSITDTIRKATTKRRSETATITDSGARLLVKLKSIAESLTVTDSIRRAITKELNETATIVESVRKNITRRFSETVTITASAIAQAATYTKNLLESITITDSVRRGAGKSLDELATIADGFYIRLNGINALWRELYTDTADAWNDLYTNPGGTWHDKYQDN